MWLHYRTYTFQKNKLHIERCLSVKRFHTLSESFLIYTSLFTLRYTFNDMITWTKKNHLILVRIVNKINGRYEQLVMHCIGIAGNKIYTYKCNNISPLGLGGINKKYMKCQIRFERLVVVSTRQMLIKFECFQRNTLLQSHYSGWQLQVIDWLDLIPGIKTVRS